LNGFYINPSIAEPLIKQDYQNSDSRKIELKSNYLDNLPNDNYIIGPGDTLRIIISREYPELFHISTVDAFGTIYLPRLKRIYVKGLTIPELTTLLDLKFKEFIKYPSSEIEVSKYRNIKIIVNGEVSNPGLQEMEGAMSSIEPIGGLTKITESSIPSNLDLSFLKSSIDKDPTGIMSALAGTDLNNAEDLELPNSTGDLIPQMSEQNIYFPKVMDAIRESGGITEYTNLSNVEIIRKDTISNGGGKIKATLNLEDLMNLDNTQNIRVYDGDIINISRNETPNLDLIRESTQLKYSPKTIPVMVTGRVLLPGIKNVSRDITLIEAIDYAGGSPPFVKKGPVFHIRTNNDSTVTKRKIKYSRNYKRGSYKNPYLKGGDIIVVTESGIQNAAVWITTFTSPVTNLISTYGLIKTLRN